MKLSSSIVLISLFAATPTLAETAAERAACTPDVWRLCASDIPDVGAIKSCLRRERSRLSTACRTVMDTADRTTQVAANGATSTARP